jgi:hypothetical protein
MNYKIGRISFPKIVVFFIWISIANLFANDISDSESFSAFLKGDMKNAIPYLTD